MPKSKLSRRIALLEERLGVGLFHRTTRRVHLTDEGDLLLQRCRRALDELSEAQADLAQRQHAPSGLLRIGLPTIGYRFLLPVLPGFQQRYPQVQLELELTRHWLLALMDQRTLLDHDARLALSIRLRIPYVDPISVLQVDLLQRWRASGREDDDLLRALVACVNGVSQGVQNTG
ncbi:hypothetical protein G6F62_013999 [Rhizopus arrhizus]|nr:hypothetical protein G6F62_013999 [Rhizopus arrhizus]